MSPAPDCIDTVLPDQRGCAVCPRPHSLPPPATPSAVAAPGPRSQSRGWFCSVNEQCRVYAHSLSPAPCTPRARVDWPSTRKSESARQGPAKGESESRGWEARGHLGTAGGLTLQRRPARVLARVSCSTPTADGRHVPGYAPWLSILAAPPGEGELSVSSLQLGRRAQGGGTREG